MNVILRTVGFKMSHDLKKMRTIYFNITILGAKFAGDTILYIFHMNFYLYRFHLEVERV